MGEITSLKILAALMLVGGCAGGATSVEKKAGDATSESSGKSEASPKGPASAIASYQVSFVKTAPDGKKETRGIFVTIELEQWPGFVRAPELELRVRGGDGSTVKSHRLALPKRRGHAEIPPPKKPGYYALDLLVDGRAVRSDLFSVGQTRCGAALEARVAPGLKPQVMSYQGTWHLSLSWWRPAHHRSPFAVEWIVNGKKSDSLVHDLTPLDPKSACEWIHGAVLLEIPDPSSNADDGDDDDDDADGDEGDDGEGKAKRAPHRWEARIHRDGLPSIAVRIAMTRESWESSGEGSPADEPEAPDVSWSSIPRPSLTLRPDPATKGAARPGKAHPPIPKGARFPPEVKLYPFPMGRKLTGKHCRPDGCPFYPAVSPDGKYIVDRREESDRSPPHEYCGLNRTLVRHYETAALEEVPSRNHAGYTELKCSAADPVKLADGHVVVDDGDQKLIVKDSRGKQVASFDGSDYGHVDICTHPRWKGFVILRGHSNSGGCITNIGDVEFLRLDYPEKPGKAE